MSEPRRLALLAAFATPAAILDAARQLRGLGYRALDAYTPFPVDGLDAALRPAPLPVLPAAMCLGAALGGGYGWFLQYWAEVLSYPLNVGGRPPDSWPAFTVSAFELTLLFAVAGGFFALLATCRLPRLHHPLFAADLFERASRDRFVLSVAAADPSFEPQTLRRLLERCGAQAVEELWA